MKRIGNLFGSDLYIDSKDEKTIKLATDWIQDLEARERRVRTKEIEMDLKIYSRTD